MAASSSPAGSTVNSRARTTTLPASRNAGCLQGFTRAGEDSSGIVRHCAVGIPGVPASQAVDDFLQQLAVGGLDVGQQADQRDLETDDDEYRRQDQRLDMTHAAAGRVEPDEPE